MATNSTDGGGPILDVRGLKTYFYTEDGVVQAVNGVDFTIREGEVMGLVGESGSGKSVTSLSIMRLLAASGKIVAGEVRFKGRDLASLTEEEMVKIRGEQMSMIFQQPTSCLNLSSRSARRWPRCWKSTRVSTGNRPGNRPSRCFARSASRTLSVAPNPSRMKFPAARRSA
jgi:ABC-type oligopeptide transport system ATPase subunit